MKKISTRLGRLNLQSKFITFHPSDLKKRFKEHNNGESQATKPFRPFKLIFYEAFLNRIDAKNREVYLKGGYGRKTIKSILNRYLDDF